MQSIEQNKRMRAMAVRLLIGLIVVLLICVFFSGTIKTYITPKVLLVKPAYGYFSDDIQLQSTLTFSSTYEIDLPHSAADMSLVIDEVFVASGKAVTAGDVLFTAHIDEVDQHLASLRKEFSELQAEFLELEATHSNLYVSANDRAWIDAYSQLLNLKTRVNDLRTQTMPNGELLKQADADLQEAQRRFDECNRMGISEPVKTYLLRRNSIEIEVENITQQMATLQMTAEQVAVIRAPHDGYIISVNIEPNELFSGSKPAIVMSGSNASYGLRAVVDEVSVSVTDNMPTYTLGSGGFRIDQQITELGYDMHGRAYAEAFISENDLMMLGGVTHLLKNGATLHLVYQSESLSTLVPITALRGIDGDYYVYVVNEEENVWGQHIRTVERINVSVVEMSEDYASVAEDISGYYLITMEDQPLQEGTEIIVYQ